MVVIILLILIILAIHTHVVESNLIGDLHDKLITRLNCSLQGGLFFLELLDIFDVLLVKGLQLDDLLTSFLNIFTQLSNFLYNLVEILDQSMGQLDFVGKASNAIMTFRRQHHSICSFKGSAQELARSLGKYDWSSTSRI
jgi:hypothetical protein